MSSIVSLLLVHLPLALTTAERLRAMKREDNGLPWGWIGLGALVVAAIAIAMGLRARRVDARVERDVLKARTMDRGFDAEEQELMQKIADRQTNGRASDLVPKVRRYDEALESFLADEASEMDEEEREALARRLGSLRKKLGFQHMAEYRQIPSTREVPVGTALMARAAGRADDPQRACVVHHVDELEIKVQFVSGQGLGGAEDPDHALPYGAGDRLEFFFAHGPHRRCRFAGRITGPAEGRGAIFPLAHAPVDNITLSRSGRGDISVDGELRLAGGHTISVVLLEITGSGAQLAAPLPEKVTRGTLAFRLPGEKKLLEADVIRPETGSNEASPLERSRLRFRSLPEDTRQRIFQFIRQASALPTA